MRTTDFVTTLFEGKSNPNNMTVSVLMALNAVKQGYTSTIILMVEAVELGQPGATEGIDIGHPFSAVSGLLEEYLSLGGQVCICNACMEHNGFTPQDMDPRFEGINAPDVVTLLMHAKGSLQIT